MYEALEVSIPELSEPEPEIVTLSQAAKICAKENLGLSLYRLRRLEKEGKIPSFRIGNRIFVSMTMLRKYIKDTSSPLWTK